MAIAWSRIEPFVQHAHEQFGRIERADVMEIADQAGAGDDDDVVDAIDAIGSRVFNTPADMKSFLESQNVVTG